MSLPDVVSHEEWRAARVELLAEEKAMTRARDALNTKRRELPMVLIEKDYRFQGPSGTASLVELFDGHHQLIVQHFMFDPSWEDGCPSCSAAADEMSDGLQEPLHVRDTQFVVVARAPLDTIERYKARKGWDFPWYSSHGSDFNYDFNVTIDESVAPIEFNFRHKAELEAVGMGWPPRRWAARTTSSISHLSAARKTGKSRRVVPTVCAPRSPTSRPEQ